MEPELEIDVEPAQGLQEDEHEVYVVFINTTLRTLDLYWKPAFGRARVEFTLKPQDTVPVNTYNTHTWYFRDYYTGERMHVYSKRLFHPVRIRIARDPMISDELIDVRSQIKIHFPLRSLKENCTWLVAKWLRRTFHRPRDQLNNYMIPETIREQLHITMDTIESYYRQAHLRRMRILERRARL